MSFDHARVRPPLLVLLSFVAGATLVAWMPASWLFVMEGQHTQEEGEREVWACPMLCIKLDGPGICPVCGMDLEQIEDTGAELILNERERALIDLQTDEVSRRPVSRTLRAFGRVELNPRRVERVSAWVSGRITRLYSDTLYTEVRQGDHLFEIYSPSLFAAQTELLAARRGGGGRIVESARDKLRLYGLLDAQIIDLEAAGVASHTTVVHSPASGTVFEIHAKEGDYVKEGEPLYTVADERSLWLHFDAYEADLPWIAEGQAVSLQFESRPGEPFSGTIEFIDRYVQEETRTIKVRVVLENLERTLSPGMWASVEVKVQLDRRGVPVKPSSKKAYHCYMHPEVRDDHPSDCSLCGMPLERAAAEDAPRRAAPRVLSIPRSAVLDTGARQLVYVMVTPPEAERVDGEWRETRAAAFEAREVVLGPRGDEHFVVIDGLRAGEHVVTHGAFLIDSQMELLGKPSLLAPSQGTGGGDD